MKKEARRGDAAAIQTMKKAPAKWAREYAGKVVAAKRHTKKSAPRKSACHIPAQPDIVVTTPDVMMFVAEAKITLPDLEHTEEDLKKYMFGMPGRLIDHAATYVAIPDRAQSGEFILHLPNI